MPKIRFQILLEPDQLDDLRRIQTRTAAPIASQVRQAVATWIATHGGKPTAARRTARRRNHGKGGA